MSTCDRPRASPRDPPHVAVSPRDPPHVAVSPCGARQVLGFVIGVVSDTHGAAAIEAAIGAFLETWLDSLDAMPAAKYKEN
eukprot:4396829-Prymnesium_polylepis.1